MRTQETVFARAIFHLLLFAGCLLVFITPPIQNADEDSHLIRAVMVANGQIDLRQEGEAVGQDVPTSLIAYVDAHRYLMQQPSARYSYQRWYADSHMSADTQTELHGYSGQSLSPLYYVPQALGIIVGKFMYWVAPVDFNWAAAGYFARLGNLLAYALVFSWAINIAPRFAAGLAFLAATPMAMSLAASASYDVTVILSAVAFFAAAMRSAERKGGPSRSDFWLLVVLGFALGHSKAVYAPVMLTMLVLSPALGIRKLCKWGASCGAAAIAGAFFSSVLFGLPDQSNLQTAIHGQVEYVLRHWLEMPGLVFSSLIQFRESLFVSMLGSLGWLDTNFPMPFLVFWLGVGLIAVLSDAGSVPRFPRAATSGLALVFGSALALFLLFLAMYVSWTSLTTGIGAPLIDSVQGRYLLPIVPYVVAGATLLLSSLLPGPIFQRSPALRLQLTVSAAGAALTVLVVVFRYWVPLGS